MGFRKEGFLRCVVCAENSDSGDVATRELVLYFGGDREWGVDMHTFGVCWKESVACLFRVL